MNGILDRGKFDLSLISTRKIVSKLHLRSANLLISSRQQAYQLSLFVLLMCIVGYLPAQVNGTCDPVNTTRLNFTITAGDLTGAGCGGAVFFEPLTSTGEVIKRQSDDSPVNQGVMATTPVYVELSPPTTVPFTVQITN